MSPAIATMIPSAVRPRGQPGAPSRQPRLYRTFWAALPHWGWGGALSNYGGIFDPDPYPAFEGTPADTAGVLCNTRDEFIRETRKQCKAGS